MAFTATQLQQIAMSGGSLVVDGSKYTATQLQQIAMSGAGTGSKLHVSNATRLTATQLAQIAMSGGANGRVTFDVMD